MKRKLTSILLMSALLVGGASTFVSCKDFDGDSVAENNAKLAGLDALLQEKIQELNALKTKVDGQGEKIDDLLSRVATAEDKLNSIIWIVDYESELRAWALAQKDDQLLDYLYGLKSVCPDYEDLVTKQYLAQYCSADTEEFVDAIEDCINKKIAEYCKLEGLQSIEDFMNLVNQIPTFVQTAKQKLAELEGQDKLLNARIDKLVTSVNVDMVSNPIYGTFNTPFGIKSYVLTGFVGGQIEKADFNGVKVGGLAASLDAGNVYLTVNPAEVDAEGWSLDLVGRDGKPAPGFGNLVLVADNTPVTTISTRASNGLGGYVAAAKLDDAAAAKVVIDKEGLKDVAKNVLGKLRGQEALDITNAVYTIYNQFNNIIPQYYAIKCQVKDDKSNGETKTKTYVSDYDIAAVTVKPLAYTTNIGVVGEKVNIPSIPAFEDLLGIEIKNIEFDDIKVNKITGMQFAAKVPSANMYAGVMPTSNGIYDDNTAKKLYVYVDGEILTFEYSKRDNTTTTDTYLYTMEGDVDDVIRDINSQLSKVESNVNTTLNSVKGALDKAGKYYNKVAPKLNKVISKVNYVLDNANQLLQPIMLGVADGDAFRLSEVEAAPTVVKANGENAIVLAPTSYTLELLAPAYKKSIKVNGTELNNATLDGATKTVVATLKAGKNTIEYSTMDFYGNVVTKKYYVEVR